MFPIHLFTVGFKDNLGVHITPKYLNVFTDPILSLFIFTCTIGFFYLSVKQLRHCF
jgi:hypothetical protein